MSGIVAGDGRDGEAIEVEDGVAGPVAAGDDKTFARAEVDPAADAAADGAVLGMLAGTPDIGEVRGTQQAEVGEDRAGEEKVHPPVRPVGRDEAHEGGGDEARGRVDEPTARNAEAGHLLERVRLDPDDGPAVAGPDNEKKGTIAAAEERRGELAGEPVQTSLSGAWRSSRMVARSKRRSPAWAGSLSLVSSQPLPRRQSTASSFS